MGAFFTNVQVHTGGRPAGAVRAQVVESIRRLASAADLVEVLDPDAPADRTLLVGPAGAEPWVAVYDELTENQSTDDLDRLASCLSRDVGGHAVGVLVHDDDILQLRLHRDGQLVDAFDSNPDYFRSDVIGRDRRVGGDPAAWQTLFVGGATAEQFRQALAANVVQHQNLFYGLAPLLGLNLHLCMEGYEYLSRDDIDWPDDAQALIDQVEAFRFRSRTSPTYQRHAAGAPQLVEYARTPTMRFAVGDSLRGLSISARNTGGEGKGLRVLVWGEAVSQGLIRPGAVELVKLSGRHGEPSIQGAPLVERQTDQGPCWEGTLPDYVITAGLAEPLLMAPGESSRRAFEAFSATTVHANILGDVVQAGGGAVHLALVPLESAEGRFVSTITVTVEAR